MGESVLALARNRVELFALEWQEEKLRLLNLLIWVSVAVTLGVAGLLVGLGALALWLWSVAGYPGLVGLALTLVGAALGLVWGLRRRLQCEPAPFTETVAEFRKDGECLKKDQ
jgi:uncharacterized membrane protein YqjE